jgi:hypothetical protein
LGETVDAEKGDGAVVLGAEMGEEVEAEVAAKTAVLIRAENLHKERVRWEKARERDE